MKKVTAIITIIILIISTILVSFSMQIFATEAEFYYIPNDPGYKNLSAVLTAIGAQTAWDYATGENIVVAIVDSGVIDNHPDLEANLFPGYSVSSLSPNYDLVGHGTNVAGVAGAVRK